MVRYLTDLPVEVLREHLRGIEQTCGAESVTARIYREAIAHNRKARARAVIAPPANSRCGVSENE
jgi:hypothetical protein